MLLLFFIHAIAFATIVESRGPHHPRGEPVVRHHVHYRPTKGSEQKITQDVELLHDKEHLQEHLEEIIDQPNLSNMTDEELEFYYFQVHDADKNNKLDGLEILQAIQHTSHKHDGDEHDYEENKIDDGNSITNQGEEDDINYYIDLIDKVFEEDDADRDGYLSYPEYVAGRKKDAVNNIQPVVNMIK